MAFEIIPQKLIYGGDALGHHEGRAVFVPRVLPGERAEVEKVHIAKGVIHARPLRILDPSPERIEPPCPYFGRCGGCHYQHLSPHRQIEIKREILRETLRRLGKIEWNDSIAVHAAQPQAYRNQAQFKVAPGTDGKLQIGFFEAYSHRLYPVDECLLLSPRLNQILQQFRRDRWLALLEGTSEIGLLADDRDENAAVLLRGALKGAETLVQEILSTIPGIRSAAIEEGRRVRVLGDPHLKYSVGEFCYQVSPGSFFQVSRFLIPQLVDSVTGHKGGDLALDLYAGVGLFSLHLARCFVNVTAVEASPGATADLADNTHAHSITNVCVVTATAYDFLRRFAQRGIDLVVLDPPRAGVEAGARKLLAGLQPKRIHYVSCNPPTLARDLGYLAAQGYDLESVEMFDLFPHTYHLESLARLVRRAA